MGPQGCGKGTQLKLLSEHLSKVDPARPVLAPAMGSLVRDLTTQDTYAAALLRPVVAGGGLVEYAVTVPLMGNYLLQNLKNEEHLLIDGFPRSIEQVTYLDSAIRFYKREQPTIVRIEISDEEALKRLTLRGRSDDTPEAIRNRLAWTRKAEEQIGSWFRNNPSYTVCDIAGEGTIEETHALILGALKLV